MKRRWGKVVSILLILAMLTSGGCGAGGGQKPAPEAVESSEAESPAATVASETVLNYNGNDLSEH